MPLLAGVDGDDSSGRLTGVLGLNDTSPVFAFTWRHTDGGEFVAAVRRYRTRAIRLANVERRSRGAMWGMRVDTSLCAACCARKNPARLHPVEGPGSFLNSILALNKNYSNVLIVLIHSRT